MEFAEQLFYRAPSDNRSILEKLIDLFGMEYVYASLAVLGFGQKVIFLENGEWKLKSDIWTLIRLLPLKPMQKSDQRYQLKLWKCS